VGIIMQADSRQITKSDGLKARAFGKDALIYAMGNGILLLFGFLQFLLIPKYLTIEDYGYWQLFMLYGGYVDILSLGFLDGVLVRWAGKDLAQIGGELKPALRFLILQQLAVIIPVGLMTCLLLPPALQWIGFMIFIFAFISNVATLFLFAMQATRRFRLLTAIVV
jgi:O-antigen/teichoic acid export membrane protein